MVQPSFGSTLPLALDARSALRLLSPAAEAAAAAADDGADDDDDGSVGNNDYDSADTFISINGLNKVF